MYVPFSRRIRSSNEFLYRSIRHSSAALRWLCCSVCRVSSLTLMVLSSCFMYSVRRSRNAAWACLFRCLRSSEVAYIWQAVSNWPSVESGWVNVSTHRLPAALALLSLQRVLHDDLSVRLRGRDRRAARAVGVLNNTVMTMAGLGGDYFIHGITAAAISHVKAKAAAIGQ